MNFKDLLRLLRRQWLLATAFTVLVFATYLSYSLYKERPVYRARARILIATPTYFLAAGQGSQGFSVAPFEARTWLSIIGSKSIRNEARAILAREPKAPPEAAAAVDSVTTSPDAGELYWVETLGPSPESAIAAANALAEAVQADSKRAANKDFEAAVAGTRSRRERESRDRRHEEDGNRKIRETARTSAGSENLELDVRKLQEDLLAHETRRRELDRRAASNRLRLERVRADRAFTEHRLRETVPRLGAASIEARVAENPRVKAVIERLEGLHRELLLNVRKYTEEHPQVKAIRAEIRETAVELTGVEIRAVGSDLDREELALRADGELVAIELRVLEPELRQMKARLDLLTPPLEQVKKHERTAAEIEKRTETLDTLLSQLESTPRGEGYVNFRDPGDEALRVEGKLLKSWLAALLASLVLGVGVAFLREFVDTSLRTDFDVRRHLDYPVLAVLPRVGSGEIRAFWRTSAVSEIFDTLGTILLSLPADRACRVLLVTSTNPEEGKTAVSTNLAVALARQGKRTLLVDADMRLPSIHAILGLENAVGLADVLAGRSPIGAAGLFQEIEGTNLRVLPSGMPPENPYELLDPARVTALLAPLRDQFDVVVLDTPPVLRTSDALKLSSVADQTIFVVESGRTDVRQATWAKRLLANVSARVAGVVLNRAAEESEEYYYYRGTREPRAGESRRESRRL